MSSLGNPWVKLAPSPSAVCFSCNLQLLEVSGTAIVYGYGEEEENVNVSAYSIE